MRTTLRVLAAVLVTAVLATPVWATMDMEVELEDEGYTISDLGDRWYRVTKDTITLPTPDGAMAVKFQLPLDDIPGGLDSSPWQGFRIMSGPATKKQVHVEIVGGIPVHVPEQVNYTTPFVALSLRTAIPGTYRVWVLVRGKE